MMVEKEMLLKQAVRYAESNDCEETGLLCEKTLVKLLRTNSFTHCKDAGATTVLEIV